MRISDRYIGRQVLTGTVFAVGLLCIVLVLGNLFKEIRPLLVESRVPLSYLWRFALNVIPYSLIFTIPWGFLAAVLLVFGRLSSENELLGFRMAGSSLPRLAAPVFMIAAALSALSLWLNVSVAPNAKASVEEIAFDAVRKNPRALLNPGIVQRKLEGKMLFIEQVDADYLHGFHLYVLNDSKKKKAAETAKNASGSDEATVDGQLASAYIHANKALPVIDEEKQQIRLTLWDAFISTKKKDGTIENAIAGEAEPLIVDVKEEQRRKTRAAEMTNEEINQQLRSPVKLREKDRVKMIVEKNRRYSFSMACLALALVGVPLGISARRKDTSTGLALSLAIGTGYYFFTMFADKLGNSSERTIQIMLWAPNVICLLLGIWLFRRARFR